MSLVLDLRNGEPWQDAREEPVYVCSCVRAPEFLQGTWTARGYICIGSTLSLLRVSIPDNKKIASLIKLLLCTVCITSRKDQWPITQDK